VGGRIAELGTHEELLSLGHFYASLYEKQLLEEELAVAGD
jgi:ATP-binding cassette subfamily B protein